MGIESQLIHTCIIERNTGTLEDKYGGEGVQSLITVYEGICRLVEKQQRILSSENAEWVSVKVFKLFLPANAPVLERDVIFSITVDGDVVLENAFVIKSFLTRRGRTKSFVSVDLERAA